MSKLTAKYLITVPNICFARKEMPKLEPIKFATHTGNFIIYPPSYKEGEAAGESQWQEVNTLSVDITTDVDSSVGENEFFAKMSTEMREHVYRFLRLARRKVPGSPFPLPSQIPYHVSYERGNSKLGWQLLAGAHITVKIIPNEASVTQESWLELGEELASGLDTELWEDFLLDSKVALGEDSLIRGVLYAAIACETFIKRYTRKIAYMRGVSKEFWEYLSSQEPEIRAIRYYGPILHLVTGHSLEKENKELYKSLNRLFHERNKIMHEGKRSFSDEEQHRLGNDIREAEQAISWVLNLQ